ncbi:MAG: Nif3-like dinuclear metal center hexameric protein [Lachnospiraceae bacterium]|nr:Nif3-like dinuclear metal center hexameric protein [Lachnospiraceae bacterium]
MKFKEIEKCLEELAPTAYAEGWDNPGLLAGSYEKEINKVLVCVDVLSDCIDKAQAIGADLILSHHPLIFGGIKAVNDGDFVGKRILKLCESGINYYAAHTNFDRAVMVKEASKMLGLINTVPYGDVIETPEGALGFGVLGELEGEMTLSGFISYAKERFSLERVSYFGDKDRPVRKVALTPGSGAEFIDEAYALGADVYISGDIKYHNGVDAGEKGICVVNAGHYGIEKLFVSYMTDFIERRIPEITVVSYEETMPFGYA